MRSMIRKIPCCAFAATVLAATVWTTASFAVDAITLKSNPDKRLSGAIDSVSKTKVVIKTGLRKDKPVEVPVNDIQRIEWDGAPRTLNGYLNAEASGRLKDAYEGYSSLMKDPKASENVKTDLRFFMARVTAMMALADPTRLKDAIAGLETFRKANADSYHYYPLLSLLGDLQIAAKSYNEAGTTFALMAKAPWKDVQLEARAAEARLLLAQNKAPQALAVYDDVYTQTGSDPKLNRLRNQAALGKAGCMLLTRKYDQALTVLEGVIEKAASTDSALLAEAFVLRGDAYRALGRAKEALLAYLHVDVLFAKEAKYHPKALYYLAQLWSETGKPLRAGSAKARLKENYPNSEWAKK